MVMALFFVLAAVGIGGRAGNTAYSLLSYLSGIGYYLLPIVFLLVAFALLHERKRRFAMPQIIGSALLFFSGLGLVNLFSTRGGVIGGFVSQPLVSIFDIYMTGLLLVALAVISAIIIFNITLRFNLFNKETEESRDGSSEDGSEVAIDKALERFKAEPAEKMARVAPMAQKREESDGFKPNIIRKSGKAWTPPPLSLLEKDSGKPGVGDIKANANLIKRTLLNFGIIVEMDEISIGPSVTRYALKPAEGVKLSKILGLQNNLELALAAHQSVSRLQSQASHWSVSRCLTRPSPPLAWGRSSLRVAIPILTSLCSSP